MTEHVVKIVHLAVLTTCFAALSVTAAEQAAPSPIPQSGEERSRLATEYPTRDTKSDTWVAVDDLGRTMATFEEAGPVREGKTVAIFYFIWHSSHIENNIYDITKILKENPNDPQWGPEKYYHYWGEPYFGYYRVEDPWVIRKHAQMLTDAGVDAIIFDATNGFTYPEAYMPLLEEYRKIRAEGGRTPRIAFLVHNGADRASRALWQDLYAEGKFRELWFEWQGKPLIMGPRESLPKPMQENFTVRRSWAFSNGDWFGDGYKRWTWVDNTPQKYGWREAKRPDLTVINQAIAKAQNDYDPKRHAGYVAYDNPDFRPIIQGRWEEIGLTEQEALETFFYELALSRPGPPADRKPEQLLDMYFNFRLNDYVSQRVQDTFTTTYLPEQISVATAQHALWNTGKSRQAGRQPPVPLSATALPSSGQGLYFEEQWARALEVDPELVFITQWNEWIQMRFIADKPRSFAGHMIGEGDTFFVDQYNAEFNRDSEPMAGGYKDNYYYQMIDGIRKFKGVRPPPEASQPHTIHINRDFGQWTDVQPSYLDDVHDTAERNYPGVGEYHYKNATGRNDFNEMKVARDQDNIYFYVSTREPITHPDPDQENWMTLLLNVGGHYDDGWYGYDYIVNRRVKSNKTGYLERINKKGVWDWETVGEIPFLVEGNQMHFAVPRRLIGLNREETMFDFKWVDNIPQDPDIMDFYDKGDAAPNARFNYRYQGE
jgi:hypothetical protein